MLGIRDSSIRELIILVLGCFVAAGFAGFSLLKFYEEFQKGVKEKSRLRIWSAFFGLSFLIILFVVMVTRISK